MRCSRINKRIMAYHDGELTETWSKRVEKHILSCSLCEKALKGLEAADQGIAVPDPGNEYWNGFTARVMDRVKDDPVVAQAHTKLKEPGRFWENRRLAPVFSLALVVVVATGLLIEIRGPIAPRQKMPAVQKQAVEADSVADGDRAGQTVKKDQATVYYQYEEKEQSRMDDEIMSPETDTTSSQYSMADSASGVEDVAALTKTGQVQEGSETVKREREPASSLSQSSIERNESEAMAGGDSDGYRMKSTSPEKTLGKDSLARSAPAVGAVSVSDAPAVSMPVKPRGMEPVRAQEPLPAPIAQNPPVPAEKRGIPEDVTKEIPLSASTEEKGRRYRLDDMRVNGSVDKPSADLEMLETDENSEIRVTETQDPTYRGDYERAAVANRESVGGEGRSSIETFRSMVAKAESLSREGRQAESEKVLKELLSQSPPSPIQEEATILLVQVLQYQNRSVEARKLLTEAQNTYPENDMVQEFRLEAAPADVKGVRPAGN